MQAGIMAARRAARANARYLREHALADYERAENERYMAWAEAQAAHNDSTPTEEHQ